MKVKVVRGSRDINHDKFLNMKDYDKEFELIVEDRDYTQISDGYCEYKFKNEFIIKQSEVIKTNNK